MNPALARNLMLTVSIYGVWLQENKYFVYISTDTCEQDSSIEVIYVASATPFSKNVPVCFIEIILYA